ncbi:MAG: bifunctional folylpolyglutamate synthase/dihydrofolate synthase [Proteobacteria bacterium]|nr:bifunctional folylpolyglutamate synthase/dihydrofolate synthase [Pseudomonadota bacterium]
MKLPFWPSPQGYRDIKFGLSRVYELLERLDNPHLKLPPTIHIAGTNGKGSTLAFLRSIFNESGLRIHTYTSPHLVNFNERINLAGADISDEFLNEILRECKEAAEKDPAIPITFFEGTTVAAFLAFSRVEADLLLLETGMGGRLDATNVLPEVLCSVITPISFDHEEFLGNSLEKIAREKAGIIKKNSPLVVGKQSDEALLVLKKTAQEVGAEIFYHLPLTTYPLSLLGSYQIENASLAIAAIKAQKKFLVSEEQIKKGLKNAFWPARLQKISLKNLPKNFELYLDGSHNLQGATTVREFLKAQENKKIFVIFSMLKDKNCEGFLQEISGEVDELITLTIPDEPKSRSASEISEIAKEIGIKSQIAEDFSDAFKKIKYDEPAIIIICGSLYLAGKFLENYLTRGEIL